METFTISELTETDYSYSPEWYEGSVICEEGVSIPFRVRFRDQVVTEECNNQDCSHGQPYGPGFHLCQACLLGYNSRHVAVIQSLDRKRKLSKLSNYKAISQAISEKYWETEEEKRRADAERTMYREQHPGTFAWLIADGWIPDPDVMYDVDANIIELNADFGANTDQEAEPF